MKIRQFTARIIDVPLKRPFRHASAVRSESRNVLVACELENGIVGWGEGVPREYVTGETPERDLEALSAYPLRDCFSVDCQSWRDVIAMLDNFDPKTLDPDPRGCSGNALRAAVEISVLDAFGQAFREPVAAALDAVSEAKAIQIPYQSVRYSTTIDSGDPKKLFRKALVYRLYGFKHCKVKVGDRAQDDEARLRQIRKWFGKQVELRLDANEAWTMEQCLQAMDKLKPFGIACLEQPLPHERFSEYSQLRNQLGIPIMLDESLTSWIDVHYAIQHDACDYFNLRISKCGGMIRCWRMAAFAHRHGLGYQLGCHPGETGILSAAGRHWAQGVRAISFLRRFL